MRRTVLILLALLLTLLWGCGGEQETLETTPAETVAQPTQTTPTVQTELPAGEETLPQAQEETTVPEEWIIHEEAPAEPTRPEEVVEEQSHPEVILPDREETAGEYQPDPRENETPFAPAA